MPNQAIHVNAGALTICGLNDGLDRPGDESDPDPPPEPEPLPAPDPPPEPEPPPPGPEPSPESRSFDELSDESSEAIGTALRSSRPESYQGNRSPLLSASWPDWMAGLMSAAASRKGRGANGER